MKEQWLQIQEKVDALNQRERLLVLLVGVVVVVMIMQTVLLDPLLSQRNKAQRQIESISNALHVKESERQSLQAQFAVGMNRDKTKQRDQLTQQLEQLNKKIEDSVVAMIPPRLMPEVLEKLLIESKGLTLLSLENQAVAAIIKDDAKEDGSNTSDDQSLYQHGFVLRLKGDYFSAVRYFEKLSALPWSFHWDELQYKVESYPDAVITLEVHTVSMSEEWIGV